MIFTIFARSFMIFREVSTKILWVLYLWWNSC